MTTEATPMQYRHLGRSGLKVSVLSLGGWITYGGQVKDDTTFQCMKAAFDRGVNFFDTAEVYAQGESERDMGKAIKRLGCKRSDLVISTKIFWGGKGPNDRGLSRKHIVEGLKACLERLDLEYVDIVFAHRPDVDTPIEETVRAFNHVIERGWAFYWGTSEWSAQQITEAHAVAERLGLIGPIAEQPQYNLFERKRVEGEYAPLYRLLGTGTTVWSPLASGLLSGKYNKAVPADSRLGGAAATGNQFLAKMREELDTKDGRAKLAKIDKLQEVAARLDCTTAQLALAWCASNPNVSTVITGASKPSQVEENLKALDVLPKLTKEVLAELDAIFGTKPEAERNFRNM